MKYKCNNCYIEVWRPNWYLMVAYLIPTILIMIGIALTIIPIDNSDKYLGIFLLISSGYFICLVSEMVFSGEIIRKKVHCS